MTLLPQGKGQPLGIPAQPCFVPRFSPLSRGSGKVSEDLKVQGGFLAMLRARLQPKSHSSQKGSKDLKVQGGFEAATVD